MVAVDKVNRSVEVTPNGTVVYFQEEPRLYRIHPPYRSVTSDAHDEEGLIALGANAGTGWKTVPSVTEVLDVLYIPLQWWGMVVGVEGIATLNNLGIVREVIEHNRPALAIASHSGLRVASTEELVDLLTQQELTVNHVRDRAGDRGMAVHDALLGWAETGRLPDPGIYGAAEVGYIKGLRSFLMDVQPEPIASEVMVASSEYDFAGRYDLRLRVTAPRNVVIRCGLKRGPRWARLRPGEILTDLKSSKGVYESHPRQLEAYERASLESGWEPTVARGILHVTEAGEYEFVRSWACFEDFLAVLMVWRSNQRMRAEKKKMTKGTSV